MDGDLYTAVCDCDDTRASVYPGAPEICDGINNDCSDAAWPALPAGEWDTDGDSHRVCAGDCNDASAQVWATPGVTSDLRLKNDPPVTILAWTPPVDPGGVSLTYDVLRSPAPSDFMTAAVCLEAADPSADSCIDPEVPSAGEAFFYLVRAVNACPSGEGSLGTDSNGVPRPGRSCP
jgi:hypothetical protein